MNTKLKQYFQMIHTKEEIFQEIEKNVKLTEEFYSWREEQREDFLDFCTGVKGVKMLYDSFFKEIMNPETVPERPEDFLSVLLQKKVKIVEVLPGDSTRLADEQSLLMMDILVRFEDGSYCNVEVQKIGYAFPGERCACYSSDLLLRQYKSARSKRKNEFTYKDVKGVYTIVLIDKSQGEFHKFKDIYRHAFEQKSDTGLKLNLLQNYVFIPLDIFRKTMENKGISNKLDAWLAFLSMDSPEMIMELSNKYPEFRAMYEHVYNICQNVEKVMGMYSEELKILDQNTVRYMVDQMQEEIDSQKNQLEIKDKQLEWQEKELKQQGKQLEQQEKELQKLRRMLAEKG
ncbi:PD-(D/E)XK nuclease family transposase [Blautia sp. MSJ-19]|uniref:PD-(D/E)XK nuclease family transposase n=1 Tax=Blautia sp. MSJ-19 TaxID=2841517 RepID=UPI001C0EBFBF|nr:PD-(D/E)XK nuclease family transposase [Blautia sp. MSJ-19]MBU5480479.1 PD-(D/E)XK nuclease family transposase [Blautia sp. MSJ-19]